MVTALSSDRGRGGARLVGLAACAVLWPACSIGDVEIDPSHDRTCQLHSRGERTPGYPYPLETFSRDVAPVLVASCLGAGCHAAPLGAGGLAIAPSFGDACDTARTFNSVVSQVDLATPTNSALLAAVNGGSPDHPFVFPAGAPGLAVLTEFVAAAAARYAADGGGTPPPPGASPFDYAVFQSQIQPAIDAAGCATPGCHGSGTGGLALRAAPAAGDEMAAAFIAVTSRTNLDSPTRSLIYTRATAVHGGGSTPFTADAAQALLAWIGDAKARAGSVRQPRCAPVAAFNAGVFREEILPILSGDVDLNQPSRQGRGAGCRSIACHGVERGPGALSLLADASDGALLQQFACFVNLAAPAASELIVCANDQPGCRTAPHPGQDVFGGADDLNYRRVLAFIYSSKTGVSPFDYAYFVRKVNPIFTALGEPGPGAPAATCADLRCHGVTFPGDAAPNGSDFAVLPEAAGEVRLAHNFVAATGFVNYLEPANSSLMLYPADEIGNQGNPLGPRHPGGLRFTAGSAEARTIVTWAAGLAPDPAGFLRDWLVVGDFAGTQLTDPALLDEPAAMPKIFDAGGGGLNRGQWDGLFSATAAVDLGAMFPRDASAGRIAYAAAYLVNTLPRVQTVRIAVVTDNPLRIFINGALATQNAGPGGGQAIVTLTDAGPERSARILIKLLQRAGDLQFSFTAQLTDELGAPLAGRDSGLLVSLAPNASF